MLNITKSHLIVYDFDGVMTDNRAYIDQEGNEMVQIHRGDGLVISKIKKIGIRQLILSTEKNNVVQKRAKKLGIFCLNGIHNKKKTLIDYSKKNNFELDNIIYIGNDINDLEVMKIVGFTLCPSDANSEIKLISNHVLGTDGGFGVIREFYDFVNIIE
tara:strand:+ start:634 stop:1107 length:474 start_codon:yes stop_codon:yes gene_type:complete